VVDGGHVTTEGQRVNRGKCFAAITVGFALASANAGALEVVSTDPPGSGLNVSVHTAISVTFDVPVRLTSITGGAQRFHVFGRWSGPASGTFTLSSDERTVTFTPSEPLFAGENVFVVLSHDIESTTGVRLRSAGYSFAFWTHARRAPLLLEQIASLDCRTTPAEGTRAYGGFASDLNNDGFSDLSVVQEDTADLRVFLNLADATGQFAPFLKPTNAIGDRASPSEPSDFNGDGQIDVAIGNINVNSVSILLGNGDGTFQPQIVIPVGFAPRGIAVLDFDGDGDPDIANTNANSSNVSLIENLGNGTFAAARFFEAGGVGEWSLAAADMNKDGITDLIVGARTSRRIIVQLGNGDGTFSFASSTDCGGRTWMIAVGDVNGDGFDDVSSANSSENNGSILFGDGKGGLGNLQIRPTGAFPLATDLGDLDGDGDLDWTTASFSGREWRLFTNDGAGNFSFFEAIIAPEAGSCTLLHDIDNDGDTDISFVDELADVVLVYRNSGMAVFGDFDGGGIVDLSDYAEFVACVSPSAIAPDCEVFDSDNDRDVDLADFGALQRAITAPD
jgi:FG-GAP-like repeat/Bacterial Ig-like domain